MGEELQASGADKTNLSNLTKKDLIALIEAQIQTKQYRKLEIAVYKGYDDEISASDWIDMYYKFASQDNWPDDKKVNLLCGYLREIALQWYMSHINGYEFTWDEVYVLFVNTFGVGDKPNINTIIERCWQPEKESLIKYYQSKLIECRRAQITGELVNQLLTRGLPEYMKQWVCSLRRSAKPQEWFEMVSNSYINSRDEGKKRHSKPVINNIEHQETKQQFHEVSSKPPIDKDSNSAKEPKSCSYCGKTNHNEDRCFKKHGYPNKKKNLDQKKTSNPQVNTISSQIPPTVEEIHIQSDPHLTQLIQEGDELQVNEIQQDNILQYAEITINHRVNDLALIDSGANLSAIDEAFCRVHQISYYKGSKSVKGATNIFETNGYAQLQLKIAGKTHNVTVVVAPLISQNFILGKDYFNLYGYKLIGPSLVNHKPVLVKQIGQLINSETAGVDEMKQLPVMNTIIDINVDERIVKLNDQYNNIFGRSDFDVGNCDLIKCFIHLKPDTVPFNAKPRRLSLANQIEERAQVEELLRAKLIRPSFSNWSSGITFACVPGKRPRLCGDYRYLNDHTLDDKYPIPLIDNILLSLQGAVVYSTLDVVRGYNHISINEDDKFKTAFVTNIGLYEWNQMPFGLKNAPAIFQRLMDYLLKDLYLYARVYFDDILVFSKTTSDHIKHLEAVYKKLKQFNLKLKRTKCHFLQDEVKFCGYIISHGTKKRDDKFIAAVKNIKKPSNVHEVQQFLGLANYGRAFVCNFAEIVKPLNNLRKKSVKWSWNSEHDAAYYELKKMLIDAPGTFLFDPNWGSTILFCDASKTTIAGVLMQVKDSERIIGYFSRTLTDTQIKYNIYTKELLAIVKAVDFFKQYLHGHRFKIVTDNAALSYFKTSREAFDKFARWMIFLEDFSFEIEHRAGVQNKYADALTRLTYTTRSEAIDDSMNALIAANLPAPAVFIADLVNTTDAASLPKEIPDEFVQDVIDYFHKERHNHLGRNKLIKELKVYCKIKNIYSLVKNYLSNCKPCVEFDQKNFTEGYSEPIKPIGVNQRWFADMIGPFPVSKCKNKYTSILTLIDHTSRFGQAYLLAYTTTDDVIRVFKKAFTEFGKPLEVFTDNGPSFVSWRFKDMLRKCDIKQVTTPAYHQSSNGLVERFNKTIYEALAKYVSEGYQWSEQLAKIVDSYNSTIHRVTDCRPNDLMNRSISPSRAISRTIKQQQYDASRTNRRRKKSKFSVDDKVMIEVPKNLQKKFKQRRTGPFTITKKINDNIFDTDKPAVGHTSNMHVHAGNLKRCSMS